MIDPVIMNEWK